MPPETIESSESELLRAASEAGRLEPRLGDRPRRRSRRSTGTITTKAPGGGQRMAGVTSEYFEFDVDAVHDNAKMRGVATPTLPADLDLYLQRQAADGNWSEVGDGSNGGALDGETIGSGRLDPGHYRLEVHNFAGPPGNDVAIELTFLNSAGDPGT